MNGIQPRRNPNGKAGHEATAEEKMRLVKTSYQPGGFETIDQGKLPDGGTSFEGLLPLSEQEKIMPQPRLYSEDLPDATV